MRDDSERLTYTIEQAGKKLGVSRNKAYEAANLKQIPVIRLGKRMLVPKAAFDRLLSGEAAG